MQNYPLHIFSSKEKEVLYQLFQMKVADDEKLTKKISKLLLLLSGVAQSRDSYSSFIDKIASNRKITLPSKGTIQEKEAFLYRKIMQQNLENMSPEERDKLITQIKIEAEKKGLSKSEIGSVSALAGIGAAQLSGFGVYMLASSTVSAIAGFVGVTLPFAFYTTMSTIISYAIGPIGVVLAAIPLYKTVKGIRSWDDIKDKVKSIYKSVSSVLLGNYELAETVFFYFAATRILKIAEVEKRYNLALDNSKQLQKDLAEKNNLLKIEVQNTIELANTIKDLENKLKEVQTEHGEQLVKQNRAKGDVNEVEENINNIKMEILSIIKNKNELLQD